MNAWDIPLEECENMRISARMAVLCLGILASALGCGGPRTEPSSTGGSGGGACAPVDDKNPCTDDLCDDGVPSNPPSPQGAVCGTANGKPLVCDGKGACAGCNAPADCPGDDDVCKSRTCTGGLCGVSFTGANLPAEQTEGDCLHAVCDGKGDVTEVGDDTDVPLDDGNPCTDEACAAGVPTHPARADGASCEDGNACTQGDSCQAGVCAGGTPLTCSAIDACHVAGACDGATGVCSNPSKPDGSMCDDSELCTQMDTCQAGVCTGGNPVVCGGGLSCLAGACTSTCGGVLGFPAPPMAKTGPDPRSMAGADLNGDGKPDLAVANYLNYTVSVLLGKGNGTFGAPTEYTVGLDPASIVIADLTGDGKPDLAVANSGDGTVSVLANLGFGAFATPVNHAVGTAPSALWAVDLNGDGKVDLAVADPANNAVSVLMNQGNGSFTAPVEHAVGLLPYSVTAADLNGDGEPDVVAANVDGGSVTAVVCTATRQSPSHNPLIYGLTCGRLQLTVVRASDVVV